MEGRWTLLPFLGAYLVHLGLITGQGIYTNTWAVHIEGGAREAERIAHKHGFISHGQVQWHHAPSGAHGYHLSSVTDLCIPSLLFEQYVRTHRMRTWWKCPWLTM
uniref:Furin-1-like n=1 Tax=Sinocyclocheilus rhinocerous TaxID=307959 RepID=A0A673LTC4_9TELE